jgi:hypothetical protein
MIMDEAAIEQIQTRGVVDTDILYVIVHESECIIMHTNVEEEEIVLAKNESTNLVEALYCADNLSETLNIELKIHLDGILFKEELTTRHFKYNLTTLPSEDEGLVLGEGDNEFVNHWGLNCVNIIVQGKQCFISFSNYDEDDVFIKQFDSRALDDAIFYADQFSSMFNVPLKLYMGNLMFRDEFSRRHMGKAA